MENHFTAKTPDPRPLAVQGDLQRASWIDSRAMPIFFQEPPGLLREHAADFAAFAFDPRDLHFVVSSRLMPQPGDGGRFRALLDRNPLRASHRAAANGSRMLGNGGCQALGEFLIERGKSQEREN